MKTPTKAKGPIYFTAYSLRRQLTIFYLTAKYFCMQFSANETVQAICRTLFHSLWQGLLLAIAGGAVVLLTKKLRAAVRYNILTVLLFVFAAGVCCTYCYQLSSIGSGAVVAQPANLNAVVVTGGFHVFQPGALQAKPATFTTVVVNWLTANASFIVFGWLLVIAFRCVQLLIGLRGIYILRHKGLSPAGTYWVNRLNQLAASIQLSKPVLLMQSAIAKVPMVTGHLKPMILLPLGVLTALPEDEIEAILLHELAHIRRKDYLVNMLQNICEIVFFFNPAVLWVSSLMKDERENCCDDIAIANVKNKKQFIHALISFQEYNLAATNYAVGLPGRKNHLLNRVTRIITNTNKTLNNMEKTLLATGIIVLSFITIAFAHAKQTHKDVKKAEVVQNSQADKGQGNANGATPNDSIADTAIAANPDFDDDTTKTKKLHGTSTYIGHDGNHMNFNTEYEGKAYRIVVDDDTLTALFINGGRIPKDKIDQYRPTLNRIRAELEERQQKQFAQQDEEFKRQEEQFGHQEAQFREQQKQFAKQQEEMQRQLDTTINSEFRQQQEEMKRQFKQQEEQFRVQQKEFIRQQQEFRKQRQQFKQMLQDSDKYFLMAPIPPIAPVPPMAPMPPVSLRPHAPTPPVAPTAPVPPVAPVAPVPPVENKSIKEIVSLLKTQGIVTDEDALSFTINNNEFVVKNVRQPDALQAKLQEKYLKNAGDYIKYGSRKHGSGTKARSEVHISKEG